MSINNFHIAFCVNEEYADFVRVPIKSIIENHRETEAYINIHILTDKISRRKKHNLYNLVKDIDNTSIEIIKIDDIRLKGLKINSWPIHTWYRILLPDILPNDIKIVLYLDVDTLVTSNLLDLFKTNMESLSIAASLDVQNFTEDVFTRLCYEKEKNYICAGVMLMNLDFWRDHLITNRIISWAKLNCTKLLCPDQDAINYICKDSKLILPLRYGFIDSFVRKESLYTGTFIQQLKDCILNPCIIHYNVGCIPWFKEYNRHIMHDEWLRYNRMLKSPVRRRYHAKGLLKIKLIIWNFFHPHEKKPGITKEEILNKIKDLSPKI